MKKVFLGLVFIMGAILSPLFGQTYHYKVLTEGVGDRVTSMAGMHVAFDFDEMDIEINSAEFRYFGGFTIESTEYRMVEGEEAFFIDFIWYNSETREYFDIVVAEPVIDKTYVYMSLYNKDGDRLFFTLQLIN